MATKKNDEQTLPDPTVPFGATPVETRPQSMVDADKANAGDPDAPQATTGLAPETVKNDDGTITVVNAPDSNDEKKKA